MTNKTQGVKAIKRAGGKQVYRIAFSFREVECRETVALLRKSPP